MQEKSLLRVAVICSLTGMLLLLLLSDKPSVTGYPINEINRNAIGAKVKIGGLVEELRAVKSVIILNVSDGTGSMKVVVFESEEEFYEGNYVEVIGEVTEYNGEIEVDANEIIVTEGVEKFLRKSRKD
ncbi:MAG: OB-fold nucleic acid binding domain-containing protein [Candidatus Woesearchaeota archaeon]